jgi:hypothetical protein
METQVTENAQSRYRKTDKCKAAKARYYETKGRDKAKEYYQKNREKILQRSKDRYNNLRNNITNNDTKTQESDNNT